LATALATLDIPTRILTEPDELLFELVAENLYILAVNIAGLRVGGNVSELWAHHRDFARRIGNDVISLQEGPLPDDTSIGMPCSLCWSRRSRATDPSHRCVGRSASARFARALAEGER